MVTLTDEERTHARELEEYRNVIREELKSRHQSRVMFWCEKLLVPVLLVVVTAGASGLVVPYILQVQEDRRRSVELKSQLIGELVVASASVQVALVRYHEQLCDYWSAMTMISHDRRMANFRDRKERAQRHEAVDRALDKEYDLRSEADRQIAAARMSHKVATDRMTSLLRLYYGNIGELTRCAGTIQQQRAAADDLIDGKHQKALTDIYENARSALTTCKTEDECKAAFMSADNQIENIRAAVPPFHEWNDATQAIASYILLNEPQLTSKRKKQPRMATANAAMNR